ncbi:MAG TPA: glycosyltransferase family 39 protein, partial [Longimicrobium sp.]|nr:glycosyltransferase family 39 protein [Longimicrobium sp.]
MTRGTSPNAGRADVGRGELAALVGLALLAFAVRAWPLWSGGALAYPVDYDEGVYYSAAGLLWRGVLPYRDFVFVHPPGLLWVLGTTAAWPADPALLFAASRWVAALLGACSVVFVGRLAARAGGTVAGGVAALLYALYPEAVSAERGPFLEPALNLLCLAFAWAWLEGGGERRAARRGFWAGVLGGAALSMKVWAGAWGVAALLSLPRAERGRALGGLVVGAAVALGVLVVPLVLLS